jgi:hypothetical protein
MVSDKWVPAWQADESARPGAWASFGHVMSSAYRRYIETHSLMNREALPILYIYRHLGGRILEFRKHFVSPITFTSQLYMTQTMIMIMMMMYLTSFSPPKGHLAYARYTDSNSRPEPHGSKPTIVASISVSVARHLKYICILCFRASFTVMAKIPRILVTNPRSQVPCPEVFQCPKVPFRPL